MRSTPETVVWLIRHGASTFNRDGRCQGCCNLPELTQAGRDAAHLSGERLRSAGIEAIIFSPLRRAAQTAWEIANGLHPSSGKIPVEPDPRLREIELPQWEGMTFAQIRAEFPEQFLTWRGDPWRLQMFSPDGVPQFPVQDLYRRARRVLSDLASRYAGKTILLVSHGGAGRALITSALGLGAKHFHSFQKSNCGLTRLRLSGTTAESRLELLNDTAHLSTRLPKIKETKTGVRLLLIPLATPSAEIFRRIPKVLEAVKLHTALATGVGAEAVAPLTCQSRRRDAVQHVSEEVLFARVQEILSTCESEIRNVAIAASPACLKRVLQERLELTEGVANGINLTESAITAVHCPGSGVRPVLQGMNILAPKRFSPGGPS